MDVSDARQLCKHVHCAPKAGEGEAVGEMASLLARLGAEAGLEAGLDAGLEARMPGWFQRKEDPQIGLLWKAIHKLELEVQGLKARPESQGIETRADPVDEAAAKEKRIEDSRAKGEAISANYLAKLAKEEADREREKTDPAFKKKRERERRDEQEANERRRADERSYVSNPQYG